jgi:hypothetical protein
VARCARPGSPLTRHPLGGLIITLLVVLITVVPSVAMAEEPIVTSERLAYCGPGVRTTIYASGFAHQHVWNSCQGVDRSQLLRLTKSQVESINKAIASARFCQLPSHIKKPESELVSTGHPDFLDVKVQLDGSQCNVGVSEDTFEELADKSQTDRFRQVWSAITAVVPEPSE